MATTSKVAVSVSRCSYCATGRRDGEPCTTATCLCRCHRVGVCAVERQMEELKDASLNSARAARGGMRGLSPSLALNRSEAFTVPMSFDEEFGVELNPESDSASETKPESD